MSIAPYPSTEEARKARWMTRRHPDKTPHEVAQRSYKERGEMRRRVAEERAEAAGKRSPVAQLARLDERLGLGKGAVRERARLNAQLSRN